MELFCWLQSFLNTSDRTVARSKIFNNLSFYPFSTSQLNDRAYCWLRISLWRCSMWILVDIRGSSGAIRSGPGSQDPFHCPSQGTGQPGSTGTASATGLFSPRSPAGLPPSWPWAQVSNHPEGRCAQDPCSSFSVLKTLLRYQTLDIHVWARFLCSHHGQQWASQISQWNLDMRVSSSL